MKCLYEGSIYKGLPYKRDVCMKIMKQTYKQDQWKGPTKMKRDLSDDDICIHVCMYACVYIHIYLYTHTHIYYFYVHIHVYICTYVHMNKYAHVFI